CHPENCEGCSQQLDKVLRSINASPVVAERVSTHDLMLTLVAAGYGVGFSTTAHVEVSHHKDVVTRPLADNTFMLTTYLLRPDNEPSEQLNRFNRRVNYVSGQILRP